MTWAKWDSKITWGPNFGTVILKNFP